MLDRQGRTIDYLRVSVTDRCNYRCVYCMPEGGVHSMAHEDVLTFEEIVRIVRLAAGLGVRVVRVTGGDPWPAGDALRWCGPSMTCRASSVWS